ncbi:MAG TPA: efflux RND transporter periplasmic adaptor subunit [Sphingomonadaceae bacterium]|nr:efflux RND transporter periplasmic adaptor subunit [Sphingomonadaceae bacterium]
MSKRLLLTGLIILAIFAVIFGWRQVRQGGGHQGGPAPALTVQAAAVTPHAVPRSLQAVGTLQAVREVTLSADTAGRVVAIRFEAGERAAQGAPLVELYSAPERADRAAAKAHADFARLQLARSRELAPTGAEPRELLEQRRADLQQAEAAVAQLDARIAQKMVRAPFSGRIGIRRVNLGQYLNPGDPIATLTALDRLYVNFTLPQQALSNIRVGAAVRLTSDAWPGREFQARVNAVEPIVGADTRNISVQAVFANPGEALRPGMYVTANLVLPPQPDAIVVPATAITTSATGESVIVVRGKNPTREGEAAVVPVETGRRIDDSIVVTRGLKAGDVVVETGQLRLQPGAKVTVAQARAKAAAPARR